MLLGAAKLLKETQKSQPGTAPCGKNGGDFFVFHGCWCLIDWFWLIGCLFVFCMVVFVWFFVCLFACLFVRFCLFVYSVCLEVGRRETVSLSPQKGRSFWIPRIHKTMMNPKKIAPTWRIIRFRKWLITMVIVSPLSGVVPLPNGHSWLANGVDPNHVSKSWDDLSRIGCSRPCNHFFL